MDSAKLAVGKDGARLSIVGRRRPRSKEHAVFDDYPVIQVDAVLELAARSDEDARVDVRIFADLSLISDDSIFPNLRLIPDSYAVTQSRAW